VTSLPGLLPYARLGTLASLPYLAPELWVTAGLIVVLFWDLFRGPRGARGAAILTLLFLAVAMIHTIVLWSAGFPGRGVSLMSGMMAADPLASFFKLICLAAAAFAVLFSLAHREFAGRKMGEFYTLLLGVALGMCLMSGATHFLMFYLALELVSYLSYPLVGYVKEDRRASEASLKYVLYGSVSSGAMIFGISILFGVTGKLDLLSFSQSLSQPMAGGPAVLVGILLVMAGLGYKIAAVPFHFWCPDVYEGANTPMTAFLSVGPKAAGFALLCRFAFYGLLSGIRPLPAIGWETIAAILSVLTMTLGNLVALQQTSVKRMLAYSSIAHAGYMLMAFAVPGEKAVSAVLLYLSVYLFMNLGAFFVLIALSGRIENEETLEGFRGLGYRYPVVAILMGLFLFSLTGIPPTAGFIGKLYLFSALIDSHLYWLAVVGVLNSVVSLYYYARVLKVMFLEQPVTRPVLVGVGAEARTSGIGGYPMTLLWILAVPTLLLGLFWGPLAELVQAGVRGIF
jgi:NADH-quinone oxidoreductase subunit N